MLVWQAYTGPSPIRQLAEAPLSAIEVQQLPSSVARVGRYGQISIDGKRFWVRYEYWPVLSRWMARPAVAPEPPDRQ